MDTKKELLDEMENEAITTRKMLSIVPTEKFEWAPHPKSMTLQRLATHVAEIPGWLDMAVNQDGIDFNEAEFVPYMATDAQDLLDLFQKSYTKGRLALESLSPDAFDKPWMMKGGEAVYLDTTKYGMIRHAFCQNVHHRAQLGVYLRLLDIPIPGSYGPSADEMGD